MMRVAYRTAAYAHHASDEVPARFQSCDKVRLRLQLQGGDCLSEYNVVEDCISEIPECTQTGGALDHFMGMFERT